MKEIQVLEGLVSFKKNIREKIILFFFQKKVVGDT
ncbi:hypothetical protein SAI_0476 [Streptococcus agalactiae H36B]|nr:hypothetical protein SAI_0476 [Streptococcus agalactiae H36B]